MFLQSSLEQSQEGLFSRDSVEKLGDIYSSGYSSTPADQEMEEPQEQGYGFDFGMSF